MALHEPDAAWAEVRCLAALNDSRPDVRRAAVQGLGHIARLHGRLTNSTVVGELAKLRSDPEVKDAVEDALVGILTFTDAREIRRRP